MASIAPENAQDWINGWTRTAEENVAMLAPRSATGHWELFPGDALPDDYEYACQGKRFTGIEKGIITECPDGPVFVWVEPAATPPNR